MHPNIDPATALGGGTSIKPGTALSGTTPAAGTWVDMGECLGPVYAEFIAGDATGTPTSFTATCKLRQADTSGGSGAEDVPIQDSALVLSANGQSGFVKGQRSKRYVQAHSTPAFSGGSSPTLPVAATVHGTKIHAP